MLEKKIEHIAYQLQQNKESGQPGAIVFIGAGCSITAGIPGSDKIVDYVLEHYKDNPDIKSFDKKPTYAELMSCLGPIQRNKIFKHYVEDAKINVSHIYLAHLMSLGYVDYIVTVNFDNLAQRALALYNIFPPTYDISILKDLTTTTLDTKSITYLHGQYNGLWQLNTKEEMNKVIESNVAKSIFDKITNNRLWIMVGYSGEDFIFDQLAKLGRFDNGLYWVGYKDNEPTTRVLTSLLNKPNTESFYVKGYDADSFFLKLNAELKNEDPKIFNSPFSYLAKLQDSIKDIDDSEEYKSVKERFIESKKMVLDSINKYEKPETDIPQMTNEEIEENQLRKALIDCLISEKYEDLISLEIQVMNKKYLNLLPTISDIYNNWGNYFGTLAETKSGEEAEKLYSQAFEKYSKAIKIDPNMHAAYYNWGNFLANLAKVNSGEKAEKLYLQAFEKYNKAVKINPNKHEAYNNWGNNLGSFAKVNSGEKAEKLYLQAFEKFSEAIKIKPDKNEAFNNWGVFLGRLARTKTGKDAEDMYLLAFEKFRMAIEIKPDKYEAYGNWGNFLAHWARAKSGEDVEKVYLQAFEKYREAIKIKSDFHQAYYYWGSDIGNLAKTKSGADAEKLYLQAFEKYREAIEIKPNYLEAFQEWGANLADLAKIKSGEEAEKLYLQAFEKLNRGVELGGSSYNLSCIYALKNDKTKALETLEIALKKKEITTAYVESDVDWKAFLDNHDFITLMEKYK